MCPLFCIGMSISVVYSVACNDLVKISRSEVNLHLEIFPGNASICKRIYFSLYVIAALGDQLSAVDSLIDSMSLIYEADDRETFEDLFKPSKIPNPHFQRLYQVR